VHLHFTPTYASWLNQIELWFSKMERDLIARGIFRSVRDLSRKIMRYIRHCNRAAHPFRWIYRHPEHRINITTASDVTGN
ncbi:MAG TPA: transposase, partial [bacterium]